MQYHLTHADPTTYPNAFAAYKDLKTIAPAKPAILPYSNITEFIRDMNPKPGKRNMYTTFTHRPSKQLDRDLLDIYKEEVMKIKDVKGLMPSLVVQPIYQNAMRLMAKRGGNALGLAKEAEKGPMVIFLLSWLWERREDDAVVEGVMKEILRRGEGRAKGLDVWHPYKYVNYAEGFQDVAAGYGEENMGELRKVQREYDPEGIFARGGLAGGFFKVSEKQGVVEGWKEKVGEVVSMMKERVVGKDEL